MRNEIYLESPSLPSSATVGVGERLEINCYIPGNPRPQVLWFKDGEPLSDRSSSNDFQVKSAERFDSICKIAENDIFHKRFALTQFH